jgi:hypothetical protein
LITALPTNRQDHSRETAFSALKKRETKVLGALSGEDGFLFLQESGQNRKKKGLDKSGERG